MAMILARPELIKNADPQSLCRLCCTSKTLLIDLQGTKAWARLAEAQYPPPTPRDDSDARSHVKRRELAKATPPSRRVLEDVTLQQAIAREPPAPVEFTRNRFSDFTYFLRLEDNDRLIWEGDLGDLSRGSEENGLVLHVSLRQANLRWIDPGPSGGIEMALVAIRDDDQAMFSLGRFNCSGIHLRYDFRPRWSLFYSERSHLVLWASLFLTEDRYVNRLEFGLHHIVREPRGVLHTHSIYRCNPSLFRYVLSYLAGVNPLARAFVLARIERCFVAAERRRGWVEYEVERLYADTVLREQDEIEAARAEQELEDELEREREEAEYYRDNDGLDGAFVVFS